MSTTPEQLELTKALNANLKQQHKLYVELNSLTEAELKIREELAEA